MTDRRLQLALFALTGLGNAVLARLVQAGFAPDLLVTRAEPMPYPYEALPFIGDAASRVDVECLVDVEGEQKVLEYGAELLLVATYHRRIGANLASRCGAAINLHPSLLPHNRGPNPFFWAIRNGDQQAGVTAHLLTDRLDAGDICLQRAIPVHPDETQSTLRRRLSDLAAEIAVETVSAHAKDKLKFSVQPELGATAYPRVGEKERQLDFTNMAETVIRHVNALREWPLALFGDRRVLRVLDTKPPTSGVNPAAVLAIEGAVCCVRAADADMVLQLD
jgi:methionyl-tRNA formyltransferase